MLDILIVDDHKEIGTLLCDFLRKENYTVSVAATGEKALELYEKYGARLVVLDLMLPGMDLPYARRSGEFEYTYWTDGR